MDTKDYPDHQKLRVAITLAISNVPNDDGYDVRTYIVKDDKREKFFIQSQTLKPGTNYAVGDTLTEIDTKTWKDVSSKIRSVLEAWINEDEN